MNNSDSLTVCIAIPVLNESGNIISLFERITSVAKQCPNTQFEILFIDDGSTDDTVNKISQYSPPTIRVRTVRFSRNFGHQAALSAAIDLFEGNCLILMDGDLQDPPETITRLINEYRKGSDIVVVSRRSRKDGIWKKLACYMYYRLLSSVSKTPISIDSGDFSLLSSSVVNALQGMHERHRFLRGMRSWVGFQQSTIAIDREKRGAGESKYTIKKLLRLALDGVFSFSTAPIRWSIYLAIIVLALSFAFILYAIYAHYFYNTSPTGFTALLCIIGLSMGTQLLFIGVVGEYVGRVYEQVKFRPLYIVKEIIESNKKSDS